MGMREKLIELLINSPGLEVLFGSEEEFAKNADWLIANGVTIPVRCKECKHLVLTADGAHNPNDCVCDYWMADGLNDFDFCYYGERRTDGN